MNNLIPIEFNNQRILTTEQLAQIYEAEPRRITENFSRNEKRFERGKHYYLLQGEDLRKFKHEVADSVVAKNINKLYLWTERGADRHCKILDTNKAWEQFDNLEETYFKVKEQKSSLDTSKLSSETQLLLKLSRSIANNEIEQNKLKQSVVETKEEVQAIRDIITLNPQAAWRRESNRILNAVGRKLGNYKKPKEEVYEALRVRAKCRPNVLILNLQRRAKKNGMAPSKVQNLNLLDVLENEPRLKEIYLNIVREMAIKNHINIREEL